MDDKKFDEIMHKYVSSKTRGIEADFSKLNEQKDKRIAKKYKSKLVWATVSCVAVIILALSIVLPLTLPSTGESGDDNQSPIIQYFEEQEIVMVAVESNNELFERYNITATLPTIQNLDAVYNVLLNKLNNDIIGAFIEIDVFDEYFDVVKMHIVSEYNVLNMLVDYETFTLESIWKNNIIVKYLVEYDEVSGCNNIRMFFVVDGYKYYLDAQYYEDFNVEEILDLIF